MGSFTDTKKLYRHQEICPKNGRKQFLDKLQKCLPQKVHLGQIWAFCKIFVCIFFTKTFLRIGELGNIGIGEVGNTGG